MELYLVPAAHPSCAGVSAGSRVAEKWATEEEDDAQADEDAEQSGSQSIAEGNGRSVSLQPRPSQRHVHLYGLHLEVRANDPADVEQLVAVADVVEASRCEPFGEVCGEQESRQECQQCVVNVHRVHLVHRAAFTHTQKYSVEERNVVEQVRVGEG